MTDRQKIPATVITGFLGAGKTSAIRHILATANGKRLALIINEFGDLGVDGEILKSCGIAGCADDDVVELSNGCLCCTVADDFTDVPRVNDSRRQVDILPSADIAMLMLTWGRSGTVRPFKPIDYCRLYQPATAR